MNLPKPNTEEYWQAQSDARTLIEAQSIQANATRLAGASAVPQEQESARKAALASANRAAKRN